MYEDSYMRHVSLDKVSIKIHNKQCSPFNIYDKESETLI
jgi:hypothetical protein